jgi:fatty-acyl-CoA synthase
VNANFASLYESVADAMGDHPALVHGPVRRSWAEFDDRAARLATALDDLGLRPDSKVAAYLYNSNEYMEQVFATFKIRGVPCNVNYRYLEDELLYLLDNSDAEVLFFHGALADQVAKVCDRAPMLRAIVQVDDGTHPLLDGALEYEELIANSSPMPRIERSGDDLYFLYTGGTTGMPKGVMWRNEDLFGVIGPTTYLLGGSAPPENNAQAGERAKQAHGSGNVPVHLPASPLMHGTGFFTSLQTLLLGGTIVTLENRTFDPHELWQVVQREGATQMAIVGDAFAKPMVRALEEAEAAGAPYDLSSVRIIVSSGVMWTAAVKQAFLDRGQMMLFDSLGSSEAVGMANSITAPGAEAKTATFTIGENAKVFTDDDHEVLPGSGDIGMLAVGGPLPVGYYKDPDKTARTFRTIAGRRYSIPGDYANVDADGTIHLLGRGSVCINTGGEKVYPEEVEEVLKEHPAVADCVVIGVPDEKWGEAVTGVVALHTGSDATADDIVAAMRSRLAGYKRPKQIVIVDQVLRGPAGKLDYGWARDVARERLGL